jgi:hypothetical protein
VVKQEYSPAVLQVVRFGLPLVILIFYVSASWNFSYTPDSTFLSLRMAQNIAGGSALEPMPAHLSGVPNPLWGFLMAVATLVNIEGILAAKIFSLFFSSLVVLLVYLLAVELLRDRVLAFCAALAVATSMFLLQVAPSGSALPVALTVVLAGLVFMLRNDYLLSALMLGLGTLLFWQAGGAFVLLLVDAWLNSTTPRHRGRVILVTSLVYFLTVVPWFLFAALRSCPPLPWLIGLGDFPGLSLATGAATAVPAVVAVVAAVGMIRRKDLDGLARESHVIVILWACWFLACSALWGWDFYLFTLPVVIIYALSGVQQRVLIPHSPAAYGQAMFLTGVLILLHQVAFTQSSKPVMAQTERDSEELVELAYWIKSGIPEESSVGARRPELLAYYAGRTVDLWNAGHGPSTEYLVSEDGDVWGYAVVHRASRLEEEALLPGAGRFAVWRKK